MVSRRSVRIKVLQLLYSQNRDPVLDRDQLLERYDQAVETSFELLMFTLYLFVEVTYQSVEHQKKKQAKLRPTEEDAAFSAKLYNNDLIQSLVNNKPLEDEFTRCGFRKKVDEDFFKKMYSEFAKSEEYLAYIKADDTEESHREILLELFRFLRKNDFFNEVAEDNYTSWNDDKSLVIGAMKKVIKQLPTSGSFLDEHAPDKETAHDFGRVLLEQVTANEEYLVSLIEPTLKNWDADRLAIMDMLMLKMGLTEFLYFNTIPTKVTLNEYVEISKQYSTPKSKDFVNGILDRQMKLLDDQGKINKIGRGLMN